MYAKSGSCLWGWALLGVIAWSHPGMSAEEDGVVGGQGARYEAWQELNRRLSGCGGAVRIEPTGRNAGKCEVVFQWRPGYINRTDIPVDDFPDLAHLQIDRVEILSCAVPKAMLRRLEELREPLKEIRLCSDGLTDSQVKEILAAFRVKSECLCLEGRRITPEVLRVIDPKKFKFLHLIAGEKQRRSFAKYSDKHPEIPAISTVFDLKDVEVAAKLGEKGVGR